jgi:hypothetical protein
MPSYTTIMPRQVTFYRRFKTYRSEFSHDAVDQIVCRYYDTKQKKGTLSAPMQQILCVAWAHQGLPQLAESMQRWGEDILAMCIYFLISNDIIMETKYCD